MTFEERIEEMDIEELRYYLRSYHECFTSFEKFLIKEFGRETYMDLCRQHALEDSTKWLKDMGMSDKSIDEFKKQMGFEEKEKN